MDIIEKVTPQILLLDKGIILQSGAICPDKINLISGTMAAPLIENIFLFSGCDAEAMRRVSMIFSRFYTENREAEMMAVLHILYDISGLKFPQEVELLASHLKARQYFLFSFILDMEDCIQNIMEEEAEV